GDMEAVFIRAPIIRRVGNGARVLARYQGDPVLVEEGRHMVATFHPDLSTDRRVHELFLQKLDCCRSSECCSYAWVMPAAARWPRVSRAPTAKTSWRPKARAWRRLWKCRWRRRKPWPRRTSISRPTVPSR